jgi:hypothetical protein
MAVEPASLLTDRRVAALRHDMPSRGGRSGTSAAHFIEIRAVGTR